MSQLKDILEKVIDYLSKSEDSDWTPLTPKEVIVDLQLAIKAIETSSKLDKGRLELHFAPTSSIQELAIQNGWGDHYLLLSLEFDKAIAQIS